MPNKRVPIIGVIGPGQCSGKLKNQAEQIGQTIAAAGAMLVCGGLGGVMEAAARGAKEKDGTTIGIIPSDQKRDANKYIDIVIPSGIGEARNLLVIRTADAVVALPGMFGTLSEMAFCMKTNTPLVSLQAWDISDKIIRLDDPVMAAKEAIRLARERK
jgi:uncharacterized protein (TIGR00725 family)